MGPIRGMKKRKKTEPKKLDQNVLAAAAAAASLSPQPEPLDWWDEFQQKISEFRSGSAVIRPLKYINVSLVNKNGKKPPIRIVFCFPWPEYADSAEKANMDKINNKRGIVSFGVKLKAIWRNHEG